MLVALWLESCLPISLVSTAFIHELGTPYTISILLILLWYEIWTSTSIFGPLHDRVLFFIVSMTLGMVIFVITRLSLRCCEGAHPIY